MCLLFSVFILRLLPVGVVSSTVIRVGLTISRWAGQGGAGEGGAGEGPRGHLKFSNPFGLGLSNLPPLNLDLTNPNPNPN